MRIAITGGIGCGKSEVLKILGEYHWATADADQLVHELFEQDDSLKEALLNRFGSEVLDAAGHINRPYLAERVFADAPALADLEALTHPRVQALWKSLMDAQPNSNWAIEIPLLFEKSLVQGFDATVCVAASESVQSSRLKGRGWTLSMIENRLKNQWPMKNKIEAANFVLLNDGDFGFLRKQVEELLRRLGV